MSFSVRTAGGPRVQRNHAEQPVRAAPKPGASRLLAHDRATSCVSTARRRGCWSGPDDPVSIGAYLQEHGYSPQFVDHYILPMGAAIWSAGTAALRNFPARYFVRFFHHHGMLSVDDRPQWLSIRGGSARYVERLTAQVRADPPAHSGRSRSAHSGRRPGQGSRVRVGTIRSRLLRLPQRPGIAPADRRHAMPNAKCSALSATSATTCCCTRIPVCCRAASSPGPRGTTTCWMHVRERVAVTYNMNLLQRLQTNAAARVTQHERSHRSGAVSSVSSRTQHPVFTPEAVAAQSRQAEINGVNRAYFCGAYWRFGFHEDGVVSALAALDHFRQTEHAQRALHRTAQAPALRAARASVQLSAVHDVRGSCGARPGVPRSLAVVHAAPRARLAAARRLHRRCRAIHRGRGARTHRRAHGTRPMGPIRMLTHLRYFGVGFNPVTFYYCFDAADTRVESIVAEITNTPWNERHAYVLTEPHVRGRARASCATSSPRNSTFRRSCRWKRITTGASACPASAWP